MRSDPPTTPTVTTYKHSRMNSNIFGVTTFRGAVSVPSTSKRAIKPGFLAAIDEAISSSSQY
nr:hypothetical protein Iba_chr12bCG1410 [Ipomoea batatas]